MKNGKDVIHTQRNNNHFMARPLLDTMYNIVLTRIGGVSNNYIQCDKGTFHKLRKL